MLYFILLNLTKQLKLIICAVQYIEYIQIVFDNLKENNNLTNRSRCLKNYTKKNYLINYNNFIFMC